MTKKVNIGQNASVEIVWDVLSTDYNHDKEKDIEILFAKKYDIPMSHVTVRPNFLTKNSSDIVSLNSDTIQNIQDPKFQQELFPQYLKERGIEDYDLNEILKIDGQINSQIDYSSYEKGKRYALKWLDWDNFLSYGENNHFDFTDLHGLILLNSNPANQGGKSTFAYDLLHFLFFGKTSSGKADVLGKLFNNHLPNATELKVEGCINIDGEDYIIKRTLTRPAANKKTRTITQKIEYYHLLPNGDREVLDDNENLNAGSNVKTSQAIKEAIGNEKDFDLVISANQDNLKSLISLKETDRGRLLSRWIGLLPLEDKDAIAREKWNKEVSVNRYVNRYNSQTLMGEIDGCNITINECEEDNVKQKKVIEESKKKIEGFNATKETLLASKKEVNEELFKVDVTTLETAINRLIENGKIQKAQLEDYQKQLDEIGEIDFSEENYKNKVNSKEPLIYRISTIKNKINNLRETNKNLKESEYCPTCGRKYDNVDNTDKINANEAEIKRLIEEGIKAKAQKDNLENEILALDEKRNLYNKKNRIELLIAKLNVDIAAKREDYKAKVQLKKDIANSREAIAENNRITNSINIINENIKVENSIVDRANATIVSNNKDIEQLKKDIKDKNFILDEIKKEIEEEKNWKIYLKLVGKDGISKMVLRRALPIINNELKRFLDGVCDFDVEVEINDKNDVEFTMICSDGVRQSLSAGSGFEQTAAALALRVVLGNMSALSKPPFILLDEVLGGVSEENYDNMKKLYDKIAQNYSFCLQITHLKNIEDWHNKTITVVKTNHISKIVSQQ